MLLIFAYVDLFSLYRPDFRAAIEAGEVGGFAVNQLFLFGTTAYVVIPSLMVLITLVLRPRVNRVANIVLAIVYAVTIIAGALGEWGYYILGSGIEVALLAAIFYYAWTWPRQPQTLGPALRRQRRSSCSGMPNNARSGPIERPRKPHPSPAARH